MELQDYNLKFVHVPGKTHAAADLLSRPPGVDKGEDDNQEVTVLPKTLFINMIKMPTEEFKIQQAQQRFKNTIQSWKDPHHIHFNGVHWEKEGRLAIPPDETLK